MDLELLEDGSKMVPYCARVDVELVGDGVNPLPLEQASEHLRLPGGELVKLREVAQHSRPGNFVTDAGRTDFSRYTTKPHLELGNPVAGPCRGVGLASGDGCEIASTTEVSRG
jgi:hypothetical protein